VQAVEAKRDNYDMVDDAADLALWPQLRGLLTVMREVLLPVYLEADKAALLQQAQHAKLVRWAAIFGTIAVLCAISELAVDAPLTRHWISGIELLTALAAIVLVVMGIRSALQPGWLLKRFIAEQCRFIKFHLLLNPAIWLGKTDAEIKSGIAGIMTQLHEADQNSADQGKHTIEEWVKWKHPIVGRYQAIPPSLPDDLAKELTTYCEDKRLDVQRRYFDLEAKKRRVFEERTRLIPPFCFFLSILAAFMHFALDWLAGENDHGWLHKCAELCIVAAAVLPVIAAGVRTFRSAHEFGRNQIRFTAMSYFLNTIEGEADGQPPTVAFPLLREAENALEAEHRAWLRLMIEAEWFG